MKKQDKALLASYLRSFLGAAVALYMAGETNLRAIIGAGVAAILPALVRYLNPKDPAFGRGSEPK